MTRTVTRSGLGRYFREFVQNKAMTKDLETRNKDLNQRLMQAAVDLSEVDENGLAEVDENGSVFVPMPEVQTRLGTFVGFTRQRKTSTVFLEDAATELLQKKGLYDEATTTVVELDQGKIFRLHAEGKITEEELDSFFQDKESYALVPKKA